MKKAKSLLKNWLLPNKNLCIINHKKLTLFMVCVLQTIVYKSQIANYITNGGFENVYSCTGFDKSITNAKGWRSIDSSIFGGLVLSTVCYSYVPNNGFTYQWPKNGQCYVLTDFLCQPPQCNPSINRGYFRNRLKANLINGKTYCVKLWANAGDNCSYGISNIGIFFSDNIIDTITKISIPLSYITPQVENSTSNIITDTMNWVLITGTFVANGTEKNCVIGNFRSDAATTKTLINSTNLPTIGSTILIDDVSCIPIDIPAFAGADAWAIPGTTIYIGRPQDVGIDEACKWYNLTNTTTPIVNAAGFSLTVSATTTTYIVKQDICGVIKYDTVVVHPSALGVNELRFKIEDLRFYPNPTANELNIEFVTLSGVEADKYKIEIINALGQMIREEEIIFKDNKTTISTKELPNGAYVLTLLDTASPTRSDNMQSVSKRFVVAR